MNPRSTVANSVFARLLRVLAGAVCRHPRWFVYPQFALFALCVYYTAFSARHLQMDMDRDDLVGSDKSYHQVFMKYREEFPGEDELAVVVESSDHERNRQFVERLAAKLELETNLFTDVFLQGRHEGAGPQGAALRAGPGFGAICARRSRFTAPSSRNSRRPRTWIPCSI